MPFKGLHITERWTGLYELLRVGNWSELVGRLDLRDRQLEAHLEYVPQIVSRGVARATATLTTTNTKQNIAGCTATFNCRPGDSIDVDAVADVALSAGNGVVIVVLEVNGVEQTGQIIVRDADANHREQAPQFWQVDITEQGPVTLQLRGYYSVVGGTVGDPHTVLRWKVLR